jgi:hypothetical protein
MAVRSAEIANEIFGAAQLVQLVVGFVSDKFVSICPWRFALGSERLNFAFCAVKTSHGQRAKRKIPTLVITYKMGEKGA